MRSDRWLLLACLICGLIASLRYGPLKIPLLGDNQHQFFIAERAASGVPPHVSQFSAKNGLGFLLTSAGISVGRWLSCGDVWSARALSLLIFCASLGLAAVVTRELAGSRVASAAAALSMLSFRGYVYQAAMGARPKLYLTFFVLLTFLAVIRNRPVWIGVSGALCFLCWQPALLLLICAFGLLLLQENRRRWLSRFCLGAAVPILLYEAYFLSHEVLQEQLRQAYWFPPRFMTGSFRGIDALWTLAVTWRQGFGLENPSSVILAGGLLAFWVALIRDRGQTLSFLRRRPAWVYVILSLHAALGFTLYDQQGYPDLFLLVPYLAVVNGCTLAWLWSASSGGRWRVPLRLLLATVVALFTITALKGPATFVRPYTLTDQLDLGRAVHELRSREGTVYAIGCAHLLSFNRVNNWSKYSAFFRGVEEYLLTESAGGPDVPWEANRLPPVVLVSRYTLPPELHMVLSCDYDQKTPLEFARQDISVWIRR